MKNNVNASKETGPKKPVTALRNSDWYQQTLT
jgi:hypothetical protein